VALGCGGTSHPPGVDGDAGAGAMRDAGDVRDAGDAGAGAMRDAGTTGDAGTCVMDDAGIGDAGTGVCSPPAHVGYTCCALPPGAPGCSGTPDVWMSGATAPDPSATFPVGCRIVFPFCHPYYPDVAASCHCNMRAGDPAPHWICPL